MAELEQYCILAKAQKGRACAALVQQVLSHRRIFVFGELLAIPSVQSLSESEFDKELNSLRLFAYGSYQDYCANPSNFLDLSDQQLTKLRQLSLLSMAAENRILSYQTMHTALGLATVRELEDLLIDTIYAGLLEGKLDQMRSRLTISRVSSRDVQDAAMPAMLQQLEAWKATAHLIHLALDQNTKYLEDERKRWALQQQHLQKAVEHQKALVKDHAEAYEDFDMDDMEGQMAARHGSRQQAASRSKLRSGGSSGGGGIVAGIGSAISRFMEF